jgi:hypothetical protein
MEPDSTLHLFEQIMGIFLILVALTDVFLTVLYARVKLGIVTFKIAAAAWKFFCWGSRPFGRRRGRVLSFCGPIIVVLVLLTWALTLTLGTALRGQGVWNSRDVQANSFSS